MTRTWVAHRLLLAVALVTVAVAASAAPVAAAPRVMDPSLIRVGVSAGGAPPISFEGCGPSGCSRFTVDDDPTTPAPLQFVARNLAAGTYSIRQLDTPNWFLETIDCHQWPPTTVSIPDRTATIRVGQYSGEVYCTFFLGTQSLTIEQDIRTNDPIDLHFTGCSETGCGTFALDDDYRDDALPNSITAEQIPPGTYTVTQDADAAWPLTDLTCTGTQAVDLARRRATITIAPRRGAVCTFTNRTQSLEITAYTPNIGSNHSFEFEGCQGAGCAPFQLVGGSSLWSAGKVRASTITPGTYTIRQTAEAAWPLRAITCTGAASTVVDLAARTLEVTVAPAVDASCQFENTSQFIEITQDTQPDSGQDFSFTSCRGTECGRFVLDDDADPTLDRVRRSGPLPPGTYTITQDEVVGHELVDLTCQNARVDRAARRVTVTLTTGLWARCMFSNAPVPTGSPLTGITQISAGARRTCAVVRGGEVRCWGAGPPGDGVSFVARMPTVVSNPEGTGPLTGVVQVGAGSANACALLEDGRVVCWGNNVDGQLGDGSTTDSLRPTYVTNPDGTGPLSDVAQISVSFATACARLTSGEARCWGNGGSGMLGNATAGTSAVRPVVVLDESGTGPLRDVAEVAVGLRHACAALTSGQVRCWGHGGAGELGRTVRSDSTTPVVVSGPDGTGSLTGVTHVAAGWDHTCAVLTSGQARCWGSSPLAASIPVADLGIPTPVPDPSGSGPMDGISTMSTYNTSSCAATDAESVACWGSGGSGQLGDGTLIDRSLPVAVLAADTGAPLADVVDLSVGYDHTCALLADGEAWCWGGNSSGQVGDGTTVSRTMATPVRASASP